MITNVDRAEIFWIDPSFFAIIQAWNIGHDNISLWASGSSVVRNGTGVNPLGYTETSPAAIGGTWDTTVAMGGGDIASIVGIGSAPLSGVFPGGIFVGESLIAPPYLLLDVAAGSHSVPVPLMVSFLGATLPTQGASVDASATVTLYNALDITIGA